MLRCKQVADALADHRYWELPLSKRIGLKLHVALCIFCGRFHRQVVLMQDTAHAFLRHEQSDQPGPGEALPAEARKRLHAAVTEARGNAAP